MENMKQKIKAQGINYNWFIEESKSITRELEQGKKTLISKRYIEEKINNILKVFEVD